MADEPEQDPKKLKEELIKSIKVTRRQFFGFIPKGALGQIILDTDKTARTAAVLAARKANGGGTPLMGMCSGPINAKEFVLDKRHDKPDVVCAHMTLVVKKTTGLTIKASVKVKGEKETDEEEAE